METIPFVDLRSRSDERRTELNDAIAEVLTSGQFVGGAAVERFESEWAAYCGTKHCVGVGNGLDAIRLLLQASGIGHGDEVLVPAQTFIATWLGVIQAGATPVPVDIETHTGNMDPIAAAAAITPRTAAVLVVHLHGCLADMSSFQELATRHGLLLLEDAAQAHGATLNSERAGALAKAAAFSFYPTKNLGAIGDAGAVTTNDASIADRVRSLRSYGASTSDKYVHLSPGWNSRLDPVQAAALSIFLPSLDEWNQSRREVAAVYLASLAESSDVAVIGSSATANEMVWHHFAMMVPNRDAFRQTLRERGIATDVHYPILPGDSAALSEYARPIGAFPNAERHAQQTVSLPMHPWLGPKSQVVADQLASALRDHVH